MRGRCNRSGDDSVFRRREPHGEVLSTTGGLMAGDKIGPLAPQAPHFICALVGFGFWVAGYWGRRVLWRGRVFGLLPGGRCGRHGRTAQRTKAGSPHRGVGHHYSSSGFRDQLRQRPVCPQRLVGQRLHRVKPPGQQAFGLGLVHVLGEEPLALAAAPLL